MIPLVDHEILDNQRFLFKIASGPADGCDNMAACKPSVGRRL
jgi:hypothetical protein